MIEFNPLKYVTLRRVINAVQIITSYSLSTYLKLPVLLGMPLTFSIEPTNLCNLKCPECPSGTGELTRPAGIMRLEDFKNIIDEIKDHAFYIQLFLQGEPYLNKFLPEMIEYARANKVYTAVSSNGHVINSRNIDHILQNAPDKIIFSLDAIDEASYQKYRIGGKFNEADKNLRLLIKKRNDAGMKIPYIELQFIVMKHNEIHLQLFIKYGKEIGADNVVFKSMQVSSLESALQFLPESEKYRRYVIKDGKLRIKNKLKNKCYSIWRTSVFTWDGKVIPCCFDKNAEYELGDLKLHSFRDIWRAPEYYNFRKQILTDRKKIHMCGNCTEGLNLRMTNV